MFTGDDADDCRIGTLEQIQNIANRLAQRRVQVLLAVEAQQVCVCQLERDRLPGMLDTEPTRVVYVEVIHQAVKDAVDVLGRSTITEGDQFQQHEEGQRSERKHETVSDLRPDGMGYDLVEPSHVENEPILELKQAACSDGFAVRNEVQESSRLVMHPMRPSHSVESIILQTVLQGFKILKALDDDRDVSIVRRPYRLGTQ